MEWVNDIIFAIAKEAGCPPSQVIVLRWDMDGEITVCTCDLPRRGLIPVGIPDAMFASNSGVHTLH